MQILVTAATAMEITPFVNARPNIDTLITGVGVPDTMYHLAKRLHQVDYELVIQAGICGCFSNYDLGACVLINEDAFADIGIYEKNEFHTVFDMGFSDGNIFPYKKGRLVNENNLLNQIELPKEKVITVNSVGENKLQANMLLKKFDPVLETMEGAALHYICLQENVPFIQLRAISNYVGERDKTKWAFKKAIENLNSSLINIVDKLLCGDIKLNV